MIKPPLKQLYSGRGYCNRYFLDFGAAKFLAALADLNLPLVAVTDCQFEKEDNSI